MSLALPVIAAVGLGVLLGGSVSRLAELRIRAWWLFLAAFGIQVVAFPFAFLPWSVDERVASALWLVSYGFLVVGAALNRHIRGVAVVALGMGLNVAAIVANGGTMPVLPEAMRAAGGNHVRNANSSAETDPALAWLVDRWAAPEWVPLANVFSVGDVVIALGTVVLVVSAMGAGVRRRPAVAPGA